MKNLLVKCIETFHIYINDVIVINFIFESPFHIIFKKKFAWIFISITHVGIFISWFINIYD